MFSKKKKDGLSAGNGSIVVGGNVEQSNIVLGNHNVVSNQSVNLGSLFQNIYEIIDSKTDIKPDEKSDVKAELREIQTALEELQPDETFLARRFRNLKRMAPEIVDIAIETLKNPISGVAEVIKRISKKMAEDANSK